MNVNLKTIGMAAVIIVVVAAAGFVFLTDVENDEGNYFGLTSTKLTMEIGSEKELTVWDLPGNKTYSDISWTSSDETVVTVVNGTVTAVSLGNATVTAKVNYDGESYKDTCVITVAESVTPQLVAYNLSTDRMDYAILSGDDFEKGYLALTFNLAGNMVVSLAGYDKTWLGYGSGSIGTAEYDFSTTTMTVTNSSGKVVSTSTYSNGKNLSPEQGQNSSVSATDDANSILMAVENLEYGEYTVTFNLKYNMLKSVTLEGTFTYCEGDGLRDASGTYTRNYSWKVDPTNNGTIKNCSVEMEFPYEEYLAAQLYSKVHKITSPNGIVRNYTAYEDVHNFSRESNTISILADKLKTEYTNKFSSEEYDDQSFAQFVLTFLQVCYDYEYDHTQFYEKDSSYYYKVDIWAFPQEVIYSGHGDCEDTSILLATLYKTLGYSAGVVVLPSHMVAAIALDEYSDLGYDTATIGFGTEGSEDYYFCESTVFSPLKYKSPSGKVYNYVSKSQIVDSGSIARYFLGMISRTYSTNVTEFQLITL